MKLIMTLLVKNEENILRENIEFHLNSGVDHIIATDNRSTDSTGDILRAYEKLGLLTYFYESSPQGKQHEWVTNMARLAASDFDADWVINNDADEFWWTDSCDLKSAISEHKNADRLIAKRSDFTNHPNEVSNKAFYSTMVRRRINSTNSKGRPLPPKVMHRGDSSVEVRTGNHTAFGDKLNSSVNVENIEIFHFPLPSYAKLVERATLGYKSRARNIMMYSVSTTYQTYHQLYTNGQLANYYRDYCGPNTEDKSILLAEGIKLDDRLQKCLEELMASPRLAKSVISSSRLSTYQSIAKRIKDFFSFYWENIPLFLRIYKRKFTE